MLSILIKTNLLLFLILIYLNGHAQDKNSKDTTKTIISYHCSLNYPRKAQENNVSGTVVILYDIDSNCRYVNIRIEKGIGYGCDEAAVKAIKTCKLALEKGSKRTCMPQFNLRQAFTFKNSHEG